MKSKARLGYRTRKDPSVVRHVRAEFLVCPICSEDILKIQLRIRSHFGQHVKAGIITEEQKLQHLKNLGLWKNYEV